MRYLQNLFLQAPERAVAEQTVRRRIAGCAQGRVEARQEGQEKGHKEARRMDGGSARV